MKPIQIFILASILSINTGCISVRSHFDDVHPLWVKSDIRPENLTSPNDFKISPKQACDIVRKEFALSLKHIWHIYYDSDYYYIHDSFLGSNSARAKRYGARVDGNTGKIEKR